jgi:hypothetical protein
MRSGRMAKWRAGPVATVRGRPISRGSRGLALLGSVDWEIHVTNLAH